MFELNFHSFLGTQCKLMLWTRTVLSEGKKDVNYPNIPSLFVCHNCNCITLNEAHSCPQVMTGFTTFPGILVKMSPCLGKTK